MNTITLQGPVALLGRFLLAVAWLPSGFSKIGNFDGTLQFVKSVGMPAPAFMLVCAIIIEVVAGAFLLVGYKTRWAALALIAFMVLATTYFHNPWGVPKEQFMDQFIHFSKNNAMTGALLFIAAVGAGPWSIDNRKKSSR
ncbi:MAG: DoxX family protein [Burkholderiales bacterium]|nr:DoxX family protein [Opitutaceae bacterium]